MSIRSRVHLFQAIIVFSVLVMTSVAYLTIRHTEYHLKRVEWANHQLDAITAVAVSANRFSEQIAEFLLIGEPERPDIESARAELQAGFDSLETTTRGEFEFLHGRTEHEEELEELHRLERMRTLYGEINRAVEHVFELRGQGLQDEAIQVFRREIENRLDAEFEALLVAAALDEREEVVRAEREADALWRRLTVMTVAATLAAATICLVSGLFFTRSLTRPIRLLTRGTEAIGRGELDHRIPHESRDELGVLARRFNEMAAVQEEQHARLLGARSDLERQVAERTGELAAANQRLTDLDRLRVRFLADISHELRTPLTALHGEAEIALRHAPRPEAVYRDALKRIVAQTSDMARLVNDLMFLARSEADTLRFEMRRTVLQDLVAEAVREGEVLGRRNGITIETRYPPGPIRIEADPQRLRQALLILLDNAVKYSPPGRAVSVTVAAMDGHGEVAVRDEGVGIPAAELPHVFERFYRGPVSAASDPGGSGLGLAIAKWLVEKHGGEIAVASEEGRFTEVRMRLPRAEVAHDQDPAGRGRSPDRELRQAWAGS